MMANGVQEHTDATGWTEEFSGTSRLERAFILGRRLFGLLFLGAFVAKIVDGWLWSDALLHYFNARLVDPPAISDFQRAFLSDFAIPYYVPLSWLVTVGELPIGLGLLFGVYVRFFAISAVLMMVGFAAGGYVDISTLFLIAFAFAMAIYPLEKERYRLMPRARFWKALPLSS